MRITLLLCVFVFAEGVFAQSGAGFGSVSGTVLDPSGAAVAGAKVTVSNDSKGIKRTVATNEAGIFTAPALPPAQGYAVTVDMAGFAALEWKDIAVLVGQNVDLSLTLQVAGTATQVEVAGAPDLVEDTKSDVSQVVDK